MKPLRCLIVDDERLARVELSALLLEAGGCTVVAEADGAESALRLIPEHQPDVVFLDINMPGTNGFELLSQLPVCPPVVFVTAYDEFALRAFEVHALDYLMKPVSTERLGRTLRLLRERIPNLPAERIFVTSRSGGRFVQLSDVYLVRAYDHYVRLYHSAGNDLLRQSISRFAERLSPTNYFKANRSEIVRVDAILRTGNASRNRTVFVLINGEEITASERQSVAWRRRLSGGEQ